MQATDVNPTTAGEAAQPGRVPSIADDARSGWLTACLAVGAIYAVGLLSLDVDAPYEIASWSKTFLTDEGFHTKAAQNAIKFGQWSFPFDYDFRPAEPLFNAIAYGLFALFGVDLLVGRAYALGAAALAGILFYGICRARLPSLLALATTAVGCLSLNFVAHSRMFVAESTAMCLSLGAVLVFVRARWRAPAVCSSVALAWLAVLCKPLFISALAAVALLWLAELLWMARRTGRIERAPLAALAISFGVCGAAALALRVWFAGEFADFKEVLAAPMAGSLSPLDLVARELGVLRALPRTLHLEILVGFGLSSLLALPIAAALGRRRGARPSAPMASKAWRAEVAMAVWLSIGLIVCGALDYHPPRYFYFSLLPLHFVAASAIFRLVGGVSPRMAAPICAGVLSLQMASQLPLYRTWWKRDPSNSQTVMAKRAVRLIEAQGTATVPVIGQLAPFLGLFSPRIQPMEAMFVPTSRYSLCDRIDRWRPRLHIDTPPEGSRSLEEIARCEFVSGVTELSRIPVFGDTSAVVTRLSYRDGDSRRAARDRRPSGS